MSNWTIVKPDYNKPLRITIFDDGNNQYKNFTNKWFLCGVWKGKLKLINVVSAPLNKGLFLSLKVYLKLV